MEHENKMRHFLLYCKHWYKTKLPHMEALRVIASYYSGIDIKHIQDREAYCFLISLLENLDMDVMEQTSYKRLFRDYIDWFHGWTVGYQDDWKFNNDENRLGKIIGFISVCHRKVIPFEMGKIDPKLQEMLDNHYDSLAVSEEEYWEKKVVLYNDIAKRYGYDTKQAVKDGLVSAQTMSMLIAASGVNFPYRIKI